MLKRVCPKGTNLIVHYVKYHNNKKHHRDMGKEIDFFLVILQLTEMLLPQFNGKLLQNKKIQ